MSFNERAFRAALDGIQANVDALNALIGDEDDDEDDEPAPQPPAATGTPMPMPPCKHKKIEPGGEFGPTAGQMYCSDCGVAVARRR